MTCDAPRPLALRCSRERFEQLLHELLAEANSLGSDAGSTEPANTAAAMESYVRRYLCTWTEVLGQPAKNQTDEWVVGQVYPTSFDELAERHKHKAFYVGHVNCLRRVSADWVEWLHRTEKDTNTELRRQYAPVAANALRDIAVWGIELLQEYGENAGLEFERFLWMTNIKHHRLLYDTCRQLWYGGLVQDPWSTVVIIRQNLEIRLRHCLDAVGVEIDGKQIPLPVTLVLECLREEKTASCAVPWFFLERIYGWSNLYVHTGVGSYPWLAGYAMLVLRPLMTGVEEESGGWSVDNAISITREGVDRVCQAIIGKFRGEDSNKSVKILAFGMKLRAKVQENTK